MPCFKPLHGWMSKTLNPSGKRSIVFNRDEGFVDKPITIACGDCKHCSMLKAADKGVQAVHEAHYHDECCFITLTYNNKKIPYDLELHPKDFQDFAKRLRKAYAPRKIKIMYCGEYGSKTFRPHWHAILFGIDFHDKVHEYTRNGIKIYSSKDLQDFWTDPSDNEPFGMVTVGSLNFNSAAYVARYSSKKHLFAAPEAHKVTGHVNYKKEYHHPGNNLGRSWFDDYKHTDAYDNDFIILLNKPKTKFRVPQKYDQWLELEDPDLLKEIKRERRKKAEANKLDPLQLQTKELYKTLQMEKLIRTL